MTRIALLSSLILLSACSRGKVTVTGSTDMSLDVADAVYWHVANSGDSALDGSLIVLLSSEGDLCTQLAAGHLDGTQSLVALQLTGPAGGGDAKAGTFTVGTEGAKADGRYFEDISGCRGWTAKRHMTTGTLTLIDPGADGDDATGSFAGTFGSPDFPVAIDFDATECTDGATALTNLVDGLTFKSCP